ncbi:uncharacterized protein LOC123322756 [Coccinella septempunctata]|uniref:uncharacterized protein LOC123322756 n=1 Tax=Coccinella septempunctata TaxID=41139 RepID=UPI001D0796AB|nr:uncharacterized protein LOC123322756 [Coccinella septempunctata]
MSGTSDYFNKLLLEHPDVASRYKQKIMCINNIDPFSLDPSTFSTNPENFPPINNLDIVSYLVLTTSFYTRLQMKAYKSLNAYNYFKSGFVQSIGAIKIAEFHVIVGSVKHSQRMTEAPLKAWIISSSDGSIECAHCTCMAGTGEACSHIGALLFAVEYVNVCRSTTSCTDVRALWKVPTVQEIRAEKVKEINFGRIRAYHSVNVGEVPAVTKDELITLVDEIRKAGGSTVLERVLEPFASTFPQEDLLVNYYKTLYSENYETLNKEQLMELANNIFIVISSEECNAILEKTKGQKEQKEWWNQRAGRITASKLKLVCRTSVDKPSLSLIKQICYPLQSRFKSKYTEWGIRHEEDALAEYCNYQGLSHEGFRVERVGLFISPELSQFAASPDALAHCNCCGTVSVEIKCPYLLKNSTIEDFSKQKSKFLVQELNNIYLDQSHLYYYQVQQQMALTKTMYNDFVVWSPSEFFVQRIPFDEDFWHVHREKALEFHQRVIMPELLAKFFTKCTPALPVWCICQEPDDGRPMIECANENCDIKWFHMTCVGLTVVPEYFSCHTCIVQQSL